MASIKISELPVVDNPAGAYTIVTDADGKSGRTMIAGKGTEDESGKLCGEVFNDYENNIASGEHSHAEGHSNVVTGHYSHAEGNYNEVSGGAAHAEGEHNKVSGEDAHAEGAYNEASGNYAHVEGDENCANGLASHAEGEYTNALGHYSHTEGSNTVAHNYDEHAQGFYNKSNTGETDAETTLHSVGIGKAETNRINAVEIMRNGDVYVNGVGGYDGKNPVESDTLQKTITQLKQPGLSSIWNISMLYPTDGIDGTCRYDKAAAVGKMNVAVPDDKIAVGIICLYVDNTTGAPVMMVFSGNVGSFGNEGNWREVPGKKLGIGGEIFNNASSADSNGHAEGTGTQAGYAAHAEGSNTKAQGNYSHTEGTNSTAVGNAAHAEGNNSKSSGSAAHAEGIQTEAVGNGAHAEGNKTTVDGSAAHGEGYECNAVGNYTHAEGRSTKALFEGAHSEGYQTEAGNVGAHSEGYGTKASGYAAHAEGRNTIAGGDNSHAEGYLNEAYGNAAHVEGYNNQVGTEEQPANYAHAEGSGTKAESANAHAEGSGTVASGGNAHAEGRSTQANGQSSHSEGFNTVANGLYSHAEGYYTITTNPEEHAQGSYNVSNSGSIDKSTIHSIGVGGSEISRANAVEVMQNGDVYITGIGGYNGKNATESWVKPINAKKKHRTGLVIGRAIPLRPVPGMLYYTDCIKIKRTDFNTISTVDVSAFGAGGTFVKGLDDKFSPAPSLPSEITADYFTDYNLQALYLYFNSPGTAVKIYRVKSYSGEYITPEDLEEVDYCSEYAFNLVSPNRGISLNSDGSISTYITKPCMSMYPKYYRGPNVFYASYYLNRKSHRVFYLRSNIRHRLYPKVTEWGQAHSLCRNLRPRMVRTNPKTDIAAPYTGMLHYYGVEGERDGARKHPGRPIKIHIYRRWHNKFFRLLELEGSSARMEVL